MEFDLVPEDLWVDFVCMCSITRSLLPPLPYFNWVRWSPKGIFVTTNCWLRHVSATKFIRCTLLKHTHTHSLSLYDDIDTLTNTHCTVHSTHRHEPTQTNTYKRAHTHTHTHTHKYKDKDKDKDNGRLLQNICLLYNKHCCWNKKCMWHTDQLYSY